MKALERRFVTGDTAKPAKKQHVKPCADCPWHRNAIKGWLAGISPDNWLASAHGETRIECHCVSNQQCAGAAIYRANMCKELRDKTALRLPSDRTLVFANPNEFRKHHTKT